MYFEWPVAFGVWFSENCSILRCDITRQMAHPSHLPIYLHIFCLYICLYTYLPACLLICLYTAYILPLSAYILTYTLLKVQFFLKFPCRDQHLLALYGYHHHRHHLFLSCEFLLHVLLMTNSKRGCIAPE